MLAHIYIYIYSLINGVPEPAKVLKIGVFVHIIIYIIYTRTSFLSHFPIHGYIFLFLHT